MRYFMLIITLLITSLAFAQHLHAVPDEKPAALVEGLGPVHHPVTATNGEAQRFFDQGLAYLYAFNHDEAAHAFRHAADLDPRLAMAHWGVALALGSNYNLQADALFDTPEKPKPSSGRDVPSLQSSEVRLKTGVRLRYAAQGDPAGVPVVMLHGYTDSSFSFSRVLPLLSENLRVFVLDQRGHGDSDRPASGYHVSAFVADVLAFMEAKNLRGVTLVGHSMGSFIAQRVALSAPERVARLVLIGSATTARTAAVVEFVREVRRLKDPIPARFARDFQLSTAHQPLPAEFLDRVGAESLKVPARVWVATLEGLLAADKPALNRIAVPTLIIWGDRDQFFPRAEQDSLAALLRGAVLKVYAETGHDPHWERPEQFARDLERFMSQTASR